MNQALAKGPTAKVRGRISEGETPARSRIHPEDTKSQPLRRGALPATIVKPAGCGQVTRTPQGGNRRDRLMDDRAGQHYAAIVEFSDDAILSKDLHGVSRAGTAAPSGSSAIRLRKP